MPADIDTQMKRLRALDLGWYEPNFPPLDPSTLNTFESVLRTLVGAGLPVPHIYPNLEGGAQGEWSWGQWEVSISVDKGSLPYLHATHLKSGTTLESTVAPVHVGALAPVLRALIASEL